MSFRNNIIGLAGFVAVVGFGSTPVWAQCTASVCAKPTVVDTPLQLTKFLRKPVASSATRAVKTQDGSYAKAAPGRRAKKRPAMPQPKPEENAPEAAMAYAAAPAAAATTGVKIVTADEVNEIDRAATPAPIVETASVSGTTQTVEVVKAEELNAIDRAADAARNVSYGVSQVQATPTPDVHEAAQPDRHAESSLLQRFVYMVGGAFAAAAAAVRMIFA